MIPTRVPIVLIRAGKEAQKFSFVGPPSNITNFVTVGRLVEKKGHDDVILAVKHARSLGARVSLKIIGDGKALDDLRSLVGRADLNKVVTFCGELEYEEALKVLEGSDAFILGSKTARDGDMEGIPNSIKEAQLIGIPVISTSHGGIPEAIPSLNHRWLAKEGDWQQLGTLVHELSETPSNEIEEIVHRGRNHIEQHFSLTEEVRLHVQLYEMVADNTFSKQEKNKSLHYNPKKDVTK